MKCRSPLVRNRGDADFDSTLTPMIDVVFLLLVFFVWTASFKLIEHILPSDISQQAGKGPAEHVEPPPKSDFDNIVIRIGWDGHQPTWTMNGQAVESLQVVGERLQAIAGIENEANLILHPQPIVPLGHVIETYDVAKLSGFPKIAFAVGSKSHN